MSFIKSYFRVKIPGGRFMSSLCMGRNVVRMFSIVMLVAVFALTLVGVASAHSVQQLTTTKANAQTEVSIPLSSENQVSSASSVRPALYVPGIGQFTVTVSLLGVMPAGIGVYFPLATAINPQGQGTGAEQAITAAIVAANQNLAPFAAKIEASLADALSTLPGYIVNICGGAGGGVLIDFLVVAPPIFYCGATPA
jgi:hypothetical protein